MADDTDKDSKTEEPTEKKMKEALMQGDTARSQEINHFFSLLAGFIFIAVLVDYIAATLKTDLTFYLAQADRIPVDGKEAINLLTNIMSSLFWSLAPTMLLFVATAVIAMRIQQPFMWVPEKIVPRFDKLISNFNIVSALKSRFEVKSGVEFLKALVKFLFLTPIIYIIIAPFFDDLAITVTMDLYAFLDYIRDLIVIIYTTILPLVMVIAFLDYMYQKREHHDSMRMTKQEVKDEAQQSDGNPQVKAKIRALRGDRARERMMQEVPNADVVVTNPTHYACALQYDAENMGAPRLLAKGVDELAMRIRAVAEENDIPIVENAPLARAIYATVETEEEVRPEHYKAVAEVISFVMRTRGRLRSQMRAPAR